MEKRPPIWRIASNILIKQSLIAEKGMSSSLGLGEVLTSPHLQPGFVTKEKYEPQAWNDHLVQPK